MTPVVVALALAATTKAANPLTTLLPLAVIGVGFWLLFIRPRSQQAKRQRQRNSDVAVGDEIVTVGGIVGTVVEIDAERFTIVTGVPGADPPPTQLVMVRQAIARKVQPEVSLGATAADAEDVDDDDDERDDGEGGGHDEDAGTGSAIAGNGAAPHSDGPEAREERP